MQTKIFITYNPGNPDEQALATRLYTIAAVNGFTAFLPDRANGANYLDPTTQIRIQQADYLILFSFSPLSSTVQQEIDYALQSGKNASHIILVFDENVGRNIKGLGQVNYHLFDRRTHSPETISREIIDGISIKKLTSEKESNKALATLLGIGFGLFVLNALSAKK